MVDLDELSRACEYSIRATVLTPVEFILLTAMTFIVEGPHCSRSLPITFQHRDKD